MRPPAALAGLPRPREALVAAPRGYGFHATLKPPFRLPPAGRAAASTRRRRRWPPGTGRFEPAVAGGGARGFLALVAGGCAGGSGGAGGRLRHGAGRVSRGRRMRRSWRGGGWAWTRSRRRTSCVGLSVGSGALPVPYDADRAARGRRGGGGRARARRGRWGRCWRSRCRWGRFAISRKPGGAGSGWSGAIRWADAGGPRRRQSCGLSAVRSSGASLRERGGFAGTGRFGDGQIAQAPGRAARQREGRQRTLVMPPST